jgi:Ca-activated chloride channel homolog
MQNLLGQLRRNLRKPLIFGLCGAAGCLIAAIALGEVYLNATERPNPFSVRKPQTVLLLIDTSNSMEEDNRLEKVQAAAINFIGRQRHPNNSFAVISFDHEAKLNQGLTSDRESIKRTIESLKVANKGGTSMDSGLELAIKELQNASTPPHILLFTDGQPVHLLPQAIALLIDTSDSMKENNKLEEVKAAAKTFVQNQDFSQNRLAVIGFGSQVQKGIGLTSDPTIIIKAIDDLKTNGNTRMDLGIAAATQELSSIPPGEFERHILLFTDGKPVIEVPLAIVLVIDRSGSMDGAAMKEVKTAAKEFVTGQDLSQNQIAIVDFGVGAKVATPLTSDKTALNDIIDTLESDLGGSTDMAQGLEAAIGEIQSTAFQPIILLFTDGVPDSPGDTTIISQQAISQGIKLVAIGTGGADQTFLQQLTGDPNLFFPANSGNFSQVFQQADQAISEANLKDAESETLAAGKAAKSKNINLVAVGTGDAEKDFLTKLTGKPSAVFSPKVGEFSKAFTQADALISSSTTQEAEQETRDAAKLARDKNINIVAVRAGDAQQKFLEELTGSTDQTVFPVEAGDFDAAFRQAELKIYNPLLSEEQTKRATAKEGIVFSSLHQYLVSQDLDPQYWEQSQANVFILIYDALREGGKAAILAIGTSLALIVGQNLYQRRRLLSIREAGFATLGGLIAGLTAGGLGQLSYSLLGANFPAFAIGGQLLGWTILGVLLGGGISRVVPNLKIYRGLLGGFLGGILGGASFIVITGVSSGLAGRLVSSAILGFCIGMMIALLELFSREARLLVRWTALKEQREFLLGTRPIVLGSSSEADIYLPRKEGYAPITAKIFLERETVIINYNSDYGQSKGMKKLKHELGDGDHRKFGQMMIEVKIH